VLAKFLDVTQNKEGILDHTVLNQFLQALIFKHKPVNLRLDVSQREPHNQISFEWQLSHIEGAT
jgi:hypothetical protein